MTRGYEKPSGPASSWTLEMWRAHVEAQYQVDRERQAADRLLEPENRMNHDELRLVDAALLKVPPEIRQRVLEIFGNCGSKHEGLAQIMHQTELGFTHPDLACEIALRACAYDVLPPAELVPLRDTLRTPSKLTEEQLDGFYTERPRVREKQKAAQEIQAKLLGPYKDFHAKTESELDREAVERAARGESGDDSAGGDA